MILQSLNPKEIKKMNYLKIKYKKYLNFVKNKI